MQYSIYIMEYTLLCYTFFAVLLSELVKAPVGNIYYLTIPFIIMKKWDTLSFFYKVKTKNTFAYQCCKRL